MQTITQQISVLDDYGANIDDIVYTILITGQLSNQFKLTAAIAVSIALIFFVAGYFFLASREAGIRGTLFGDSGLQFAALFSIIVAIILFGILNILEGKELAALLGGLSGYILGRGSMGRASAGNGDVHKS
jgi:membrane protease YdiL (CAAX protease family)